MRPTVKLVDLNGKDVMIPGTDVPAQYFLPGRGDREPGRWCQRGRG